VLYSHSCYSDCLPQLNMPVVTRSKAKSQSSLINEVNISTLVSTNEQRSSIHEQFHSIILSGGPIDGPSDQALSNLMDTSPTLLLPYCHHDSSSTVLPFSSSLENITEFDSSLFQFENSKFQNVARQIIPNNLPEPICHNFLTSETFKMEGDCKDHRSTPETQDDVLDMTRMFATSSDQILSHTNRLQEKLSSDFIQVVQAQANFKQEVRDELDELRYLISLQNQSSPSQHSVTQAPSPVPSYSSALTVPSSPVVVSQTNFPASGSTSANVSGQDLQN
jgi:hypothetical protein